MKIIQIIPLLDLAGAETMCENLTNSLIKLGHEVTVISLYDYHSVITERMEKNGIKEGYEFAILTNEIYQAWSGMKASEYKDYKNIRKESLRDNMTDVEVALTDLGEIATRELAKKHKPQGLKANRKIAKAGGEVAKTARDDLEQKLGESVISNNNRLNYQYLNENKMLEDKKDTKK